MALAKTKVRVGAGAFLKDDERFLHALGSLESRFRSTRAWLRDAFGRAERGVVETVRVDVAENNEGRQAMVHVTQEGADIVRQAYLLAGAPCGTAPSSAASVTSTPAASTSSPAPPPPSITPGT